MTSFGEGDIRLLPHSLDEKLWSVRRAVWDAGFTPSAIAFIYIVSRLSEATGVPVAFCVVKALAGVPCLGCGITTSITALICGRFTEAVEANPAGPLVAFFVIAQIVLAFAAAARVMPDGEIIRYSWINDRLLFVFLLFAWLIRAI